MRLFNRLPGVSRTPPGVERTVLRTLPTALWSGTLLLCLPSLGIHAWAWLTGSADIFQPLTMIDIYSVSAIILHWTVLFTVAIAAFIVMVMKGPAFVADAYPLDDRDMPSCKR
jgi:cytochrome b561